MSKATRRSSEISLHRTLKGAQRAAKRWCAKRDDSKLVESCR